MKTKTLYHFTHDPHVPEILADGYIKRTESNVSVRREHAGPDLVHLTSNPDIGCWLDWFSHPHPPIRPTSDVYRITAEVPARDVTRWEPWMKAHGTSAKTLAILKETAAALHPGSWWVTERVVPESAWVEITDATGAVIWKAERR